MQKTKASLLLHPLFVGSLALLLLNDFYLKYAYPGFLTGKLSDFAGLIVLPIFCRVLFPGVSKKIILVAVAIFFAWFKSSLSQPLISAINLYAPWPLHRVVDYSDLIALSILPLAASLSPKTVRLQNTGVVSLRWALGAITFFSLCSTSVYRGFFQANPLMEEVYFDKSLVVKTSASGVLQTLFEKGIAYRLDSVIYYPITNQNRLYYKTTTDDSTLIWQPIPAAKDSQLYLKWEGQPFYLIPEYQSADKTLQNIRFTLSENKKKTKTTITIQMFRDKSWNHFRYMDYKTKKTYQNVFVSMFSAP
ncbi:hypothetical protein HRH25_10465 [Flavisolibacter sp. BT320]|nr:hypothetical protein [Flavisolibacter longurius]